MSFKEKYLSVYSNDPIWDILADSYEKNWEKYNGEKTQLIPKKIHQIWLGPNPIPDICLKFAEDLKKINPDWEYKLWRDEDVNKLDFKNRDAYNNSPNWGSKSDIIRYEILYKEGGIYLDTDFLPVKSFDSLTYLKFFTGCGWNAEPVVYNGLLGCTKENHLIKILIDNIQTTNMTNIDFNKIMEITGPYYLSKILFEYMKNEPDKIVVFPTTYFYSFPPAQRYLIRNWTTAAENFVVRNTKPESFVSHLWYQSWQK